MFYSGKELKNVFTQAKKNRFGIIASNVVFDTQIRSIIWGYEQV